MERNYEVALQITGRVGNLQSAIIGANRSLQSLGRTAQTANAQASRATQQLQGRLNQLNQSATAAARFRELNSGIENFRQQTGQARQNANQLYSELARQERQVEQLRESFANLQVARNRGEVTGRALTQGRAELRAAEQGLNQLRSQYNQAQSNADALNSSLRRQTAELNQLQREFREAGVSAENLSQHEARLRAETDQTNARLQRSQASDAARGRMNEASQNVSYAYGNFQGAMSTAQSIMSPFADAVKTYASFDATMSKVKAITGATGEDFVKLTEQAKQLGATTQFSASESAEAMSFLGMAGWKTEQIIGGMPGLLQLAAAGGTDLATTADIVSDGMTAMGLTAGQKIPNAFGQMVDSTTHFADVMAATSSGANTNVQMMGETFKYAASVAGSLGYSIDDVALATGLMANAGIKGSMAGTALRSIMTRMAKPTKESQTAMDKLGLSLTDSQGKMKPFKQIMDDMREGFAKLTPAEQAETAAMLAGQEAMSGALAIATASAKDYNTLADSIAKSDGAAKAMSDTMTDNLEGSLKAFESASEAVSLSLGQAFEPATRAAVNFGTEAAQGLKEFIDNNQTAVQIVGGLAAAISAAVVGLAGFGLASSAVNYLGASFELLKLKITGATARAAEFWAAQTAGSSGGAAVNAIRNLGSAFASAGRAAMGFVFSPVGAVLTALAVAGLYCYQNWDKLGPVFNNVAGVLGGTLSSSISAIAPAVRNLGANFNLLMSTLEGSGALSALSGAFSNLAGIIGNGLVQGFIVLANVAVGAISTVANIFSTLVSTVANVGTSIVGIVRNVIEGNWTAAWQKAKDVVANVFTGLKDIVLAPFKGVSETIGNITKSLDIFHTTQEMPTAAAISRHRVDGAVPQESYAGGSTSAVQAQIDTSQAQAQVNGLGDASNSAATSTQSLAQNIETNSVGAQTLNTNLQTAGEGFNQVTTNAQTTSAEFTNLTANAQQVSPALQQLQQSASSAAPPLQQVGSSASSASSGLSQISSAAGSVASALQAKAAQISSISISAPKVAANAKGGIYKQGAFLTTFAEKSPEAAIPLDNSQRAKDLWIQVGQALGMRSEDLGVRNEKAISWTATPKGIRNEERGMSNEKNSSLLTPNSSLNKNSSLLTPNFSLNKNSSLLTPNFSLNKNSSLLTPNSSLNKNSSLLTPNSSLNKNSSLLTPNSSLNKNSSLLTPNSSLNKLSQARKYLPQTSTISQNKTPTTSKQISRGGSIFSKPRSAAPKQNNLPTAPNFNPTISRQNIFPGISNIGKDSRGNIFTGKIKLPDSSIRNEARGKGPELRGKSKEKFLSLIPDHLPLNNSSLLNPNSSLNLPALLDKIPDSSQQTPNLQTQPNISINITIQGNADEKTMQSAGQTLAVDLKKELDAWWREKNHDLQRSSFV